MPLARNSPPASMSPRLWHTGARAPQSRWPSANGWPLPISLPQAEEGGGIGRTDWVWACGFEDILIWPCDVRGGLEEPPRRPGHGQSVAIACELQNGWRDRNDFAAAENRRRIESAGKSKSNLGQLLRCQAAGIG